MRALRSLGVAVVGAGYFGRCHAKVYRELPNVHLCGVYDTRTARAEQVGREVGARAYSDLEELLSDREVEAVSLCVSDQAHLEPTLAACAAGKHLLVEKPLATTLGECDAIIEAARQAEVKLMVGHILRFDPRYRIAHEKVKSGDIGEIVQFYARRSNPLIAAHRLRNRCGEHTIILHNGVHDLDQMLWNARGGLDSVCAFSRVGFLKSRGVDVSDAVVSAMRFQDGSVALMENCWALPESYPVLIDAVFEATGTAGKIVIDARQQGLVVYTEGACEHTDTMYWPEFEGRMGGVLKEELTAFVQCVVRDEPPPVSGEEGKRAVEAALRILEALAQGNRRDCR